MNAGDSPKGRLLCGHEGRDAESERKHAIVCVAYQRILADTDDDWQYGWPAEDAPGRYEIICSCGRWTFTGTAPEIAAVSRAHDDSPRRNHVVVVMHGGRRIDRPDLEEMIVPSGKVLPPASPKPWDGGFA